MKGSSEAATNGDASTGSGRRRKPGDAVHQRVPELRQVYGSHLGMKPPGIVTAETENTEGAARTKPEQSGRTHRMRVRSEQVLQQAFIEARTTNRFARAVLANNVVQARIVADELGPRERRIALAFA